jgi:hypothetical protein
MEVYNAAMALHRASEQERLAKSEERRQRVDRIAYCGKVPVNVYGASPGDCIVPARTASGGIEGQVIQRSAATIEDKLRAVGHVKRILSDGRAEIIVSNLGVSF